MPVGAGFSPRFSRAKARSYGTLDGFALELICDEVLADTSVAWYGDERKAVRLLSGVVLWHTPGEDPVRRRWVLVVDPTCETLQV